MNRIEPVVYHVEPPAEDAGLPPFGAEVALLDRSGVIVAVNGPWEEFCLANGGEPARAGVGVSYLALCESAGDPASARVAAAIRSAVEGTLPAPVRIEVPCAAPGQPRTFDVLVSSRFADDGSVLGAVVTLSPAQPTAPDPLTRPDLLDPDLASALLEAAPDALMVVDEAGGIMYANHELEALTGFTRHDLVGREVEALVPLLSRARHERLRGRYSRSPHPRKAGGGQTFALLRRDGESVPVEISLTPAAFEGRPVVLAALRDVTVRRALEERELLVTEALDAISDGVVVLDAATGSRIYVNQSVLDRSGCTRDELESVPVGAPSRAEERARIADAVRSVVAGRIREAVVDSQVLHRDGSVLPVELRITHRPARPGEPGNGRVILVARDIRDRVAAEHRSRRAAMVELVSLVTTSVLAGRPPEVMYQQVVDGVARVFAAQDVSLAVPDPVTGHFAVAAAHGPVAAAVMTGELVADQEIARRLVHHECVAFPEPPADLDEVRSRLGPGVVAPFGNDVAGAGLLTVARARGAEPFSEAEVELLAEMVRQLALGLELGRARADQHRLAVMEERQRLARDLHDTVIQDLIAIGMQLDSGPRKDPDPRSRERRSSLIDQLDEAVRRLRSAVFQLREPVEASLPLRPLR